MKTVDLKGLFGFLRRRQLTPELPHAVKVVDEINVRRPDRTITLTDDLIDRITTLSFPRMGRDQVITRLSKGQAITSHYARYEPVQ